MEKTRSSGSSVDELLDWLAAQRPAFQRATCCSWAIGQHYGDDDRWQSSDLVPAHEPVIDHDSGVVIINYKSLTDAISAIRNRSTDVKENN